MQEHSLGHRETVEGVCEHFSLDWRARQDSLTVNPKVSSIQKEITVRLLGDSLVCMF